MKKHFKIIEEFQEETDGKQPLLIEDYIASIDDRRNKIRSLASIIVSVCGMLLSANFVILFFLIKATKQVVTEIGCYIAFIISLSLLLTLFFAIKSVYLESPMGVSTKGEKLLSQHAIFKMESSNLSKSFRLLMISIGIFIANMSIIVFTH